MSGGKWIDRPWTRPARAEKPAPRRVPLRIIVDESALARWLAEGDPEAASAGQRDQAERCTSGCVPWRSDSSESSQFLR
jgi:hypothetical protein